MNKSESKYFHTAVLMDEALIELLEYKDFEYITVKELCERAGVNRSTFYLHYESLSDLLSECVEYIIGNFQTYFAGKANSFPEDLEFAGTTDLILVTPEYLAPYLTYIKENQKTFRAGVLHGKHLQSADIFSKLFQHIFNPILEKFHCPENERKYVINFYINGIISIIMTWLEQDCQDSEALIMDVIIRCVRPFDIVEEEKNE